MRRRLGLGVCAKQLEVGGRTGADDLLHPPALTRACEWSMMRLARGGMRDVKRGADSVTWCRWQHGAVPYFAKFALRQEVPTGVEPVVGRTLARGRGV